MNRGLIPPSFKNAAIKKIKFNEGLILTVNNMSSIQYIINRDVFDIITSKVYYKSNGERLIKFKTHEETECLGKFLEEKNLAKIYEITSYNSKHLYDITNLNIASLMYNCDEIYFTSFID
jgi:hypothetical protein